MSIVTRELRLQDGIYLLTIEYNQVSLWSIVLTDTIQIWLNRYYPQVSIEDCINQIISSERWEDEDLHNIITSATVEFVKPYPVPKEETPPQSEWDMYVTPKGAWLPLLEDILYGYRQRPLFT